MQKVGCDVAFYFYLKALELMSMPSLDIDREDWAIKVGNIRKQAARQSLSQTGKFRCGYGTAFYAVKGDNGR